MFMDDVYVLGRPEHHAQSVLCAQPDIIIITVIGVEVTTVFKHTHRGVDAIFAQRVNTFKDAGIGVNLAQWASTIWAATITRTEGRAARTARLVELALPRGYSVKVNAGSVLLAPIAQVETDNKDAQLANTQMAVARAAHLVLLVR